VLLRSFQVERLVREPLQIVSPHWQEERCKDTLKPPKSKCQKAEHIQLARCASTFQYVSCPCAIKLRSAVSIGGVETNRCGDPGGKSDEGVAPTIERRK
jgi:hypothetical protein